MELKDEAVEQAARTSCRYEQIGNIKEWRHLAENFEVLGFSTPELGLIQSAKELIENALDACKMQRNDNLKVSIIIRESITGNFVDVEVSDNGCGMIDPEFLLNCFVTTKRGVPITQADSNNCNNGRMGIGKFGIGLSTCFLYSQTQSEMPFK